MLPSGRTKKSDRVRLGCGMMAATIVTLVTPVGAQGLLISDKIDLVASEFVFRTPGFAHVAGVVASYDFPGIDSGTVTNAGFGLRYVAKVDLATRKPTWVSVVGAPSKEPSAVLQDHFATDEVRGFAVHADGAAYLVAYDGSKNFPVSGGTYELPSLKYVFRVSATGRSHALFGSTRSGHSAGRGDRSGFERQHLPDGQCGRWLADVSKRTVSGQ